MIQFAMELYRWIFTLLCLLAITTSKKIKHGITLNVHNGAVSIGDARASCIDMGDTCRLPVYQTDDEILSIQSKMKEHDINTAWLEITKKRLSTFKWLDETRMDPDFEAQHWRDYMTCGTLHLRDRILEADNCTIGYYGYVCQTKDPNWCLRGKIPGSKCVNLLKKTYILGCSVENWYDANYQCERQGMTLATQLHRDVVEYLSKEWYGTKRCNQVWVGFRKDDWVFQGHGSPDKPVRYFWSHGQPRYDKNCAVITRSKKNTFSWHAVSCSSSRPFLCVCPGVTGEALQHFPESTSESLISGGSMKVFKTTGIILLVIITITAVVTGIIIKIKRKSPPQQKHSDLQKITEEGCSLPPIQERPDDVFVNNQTDTVTKQEGPEQDKELQKFTVEATQQPTTIPPEDTEEGDECKGEQRPTHVSPRYIKEKTEDEDFVFLSTSELQMECETTV